MNHLQVSGNLGSDPELQVTVNGTPFCKLSVAIREWDSMAQKEETLWLKVVTWKGLAERAEKYLYKGMKVFASGKLKVSRYKDKDGNDRTVTEMVAFELDWDMKASKGDRGTGNIEYQQQSAADDFNPYTEEEMASGT